MRSRCDVDPLEWIREEMAALRQRLVGLAISIADTEEQLATTLENAARSRPPHDAERLLAKADAARQFALKERDWAADYDGSLLSGEPGPVAGAAPPR